VRESCDPFYEPSYTELPNGCSQEVQSFKKWQKAVAVRVLRTQEQYAQALDQPKHCSQVIAQTWRTEVLRAQRREKKQRTQRWWTQIVRASQRRRAKEQRPKERP
jgi:homospermidine synthase